MEMVTTFCGQEHLPLKWGIFPQNPLKRVGSKTLEISLRATARGFESHPLRQIENLPVSGRGIFYLVLGFEVYARMGKSYPLRQIEGSPP